MSVNYYLKYMELFEVGQRVQKKYLQLNPRNFYRVSRYENVAGDVKSLTGPKSSLIFVIGTHEDKVNCLKLNEIRPAVLLKWLPTIIKDSVKVENIDEMKLLSDIIIVSDKFGNKLFESKIKGKVIYNIEPRPYRTYNLDGLKYIQEVKLKTDVLKSLL
jgi:hypothetical protein